MFRRPAPLDTSHELDAFDCGESGLNRYLKDRTIFSQVENYARTYVVADADFRVVGYCSLCGGLISRANIPRQIAGHGAPNDIPVALLARLAVDKGYQGLGLGADLLRHAFQMAMLASEKIGMSAMLVHAKDEKAASFYAKYRFRSAKNIERVMLCSIKDMIAAFAEASGR